MSKTRLQNKEWFGTIPSDWQSERIAALFDFPNEKVSDEDYEPLSVTYGGVKKQVEGAAKTDNGSNRKRVHMGDIVINGRSDRRGAVGVSEYDGSVSVVYHVLRKRNPSLEVKYYHYLFRSNLFSEEFYKWGRGIVDDLWTTRQHEMKRIQVPVPPEGAQKKIISFLDEKINVIDELISKKENLLELLYEKRAALITRAITRGVGTGSIGSESEISWPGKTPKGWEFKPLKFVFSFHAGGAWGEEPLQNEDDVICVRVADFDMLHLGIDPSDFTYRNIPNLRSLELGARSILLEKSGGGEQSPVGRAVRYRGTERAVCSNFIEKLEVNHDNSPSYITYLLAAMYFAGVTKKSIKQTTGIQNLDLRNFFREYVPLPPKSEQEKIVEILNKKNSLIIAGIEEIESQIEKIKEYRSSLIYATVTGKIKV